jgi:hypothetical protein
MRCPLEQLDPSFGVQSAFDYQTDGGVDWSNDYVGKAPFGNEWSERNGFSDGLPDDYSGMNSGIFVASDLTGFTRVEKSYLDQSPSIGAAEAKSTTSSSSNLAGGRKAKRTKQRLVCNHPGCRSTFPLKFNCSPSSL